MKHIYDQRSEYAPETCENSKLKNLYMFSQMLLKSTENTPKYGPKRASNHTK